jgi:hypothetical protein
MYANLSWRSISVAARILALSALLPLAGSACVGVVVTGEPPPPPGPSPTTSQASSPSTAYPAPRLTRDAGLEAVQATSEACGAATPIGAVDMVSYTNQVLGLSFAYPAQMGDVAFDVRGGDSGYSWKLEFPRCYILRLTGQSRDFTGDVGDPADGALGFARDGKGGYLWRSAPLPDGVPVHVREVLAASGTDVLLITTGCGPGIEAGGCQAALANLAGDQFPGLIAWPDQSGRLPYETFRAILSTVRVSPPAEPVQTSTFEPEQRGAAVVTAPPPLALAARPRP